MWSLSDDVRLLHYPGFVRRGRADVLVKPDLSPLSFETPGDAGGGDGHDRFGTGGLSGAISSAIFLVGSLLRFVFAKSRSCCSLIDSAICFEAPLSEDFDRWPRFA